MEQPGKMGRREAPGGWETLCCDVRELIFRKLSIRDLARAATVCRVLRAAYVSRVAEERAYLIAVGEKAFGKGVFSAVARGIRHVILGLSPLSNLLCKGEDGNGWNGLVFTNAMEPTWMEDTSEMLSSESQPCGVFLKPDANDDLVLSAFLHHGCGGPCCCLGAAYLKMYRDDENKCEMFVYVYARATALTLGPLLAGFLETPSGLPPACPRPVAVECFVVQDDFGEESIENLEDL